MESVTIRGAMQQLQDFYRPLDKLIFPESIEITERQVQVCEGSIHQGQGELTYYPNYTRIQHHGHDGYILEVKVT